MEDTLWYLAGILFIAVGIGASIAIHELGHLWPAKAFGVKVTQYMVGFGPTIFSRKRGETEYGIKWIPLGGYIAMIGMYPPARPGSRAEAREAKSKKGIFLDMIDSARTAHEQHVLPGDENRKFYQLPTFKRLIIMLGGPLMNLIFGVVLMTIALSGFGVYQPVPEFKAVLQCSEQVNSPESDCPAGAALTPAAAAGILAGDRVIAVGGQNISSWNEAKARFEEAGATPVQLTIERGSERLEVTVTPELVERPSIDPATGQFVLDAAGKPVLTQQPFLGVQLDIQRAPLPLEGSLAASGNAVLQTGQLLLNLPQAVINLVSATLGIEERNPNGPVSVVGIGQIAGEVAASDQAAFDEKLATGIVILASLNFALFVFNMLPLLPLDGGHVAGAIYEAIKRGAYRALGKPDPGPADTALLVPIAWLVFITLMALSLVLILADLIAPLSLGG